MQTILIIDDDRDMCLLLKRFLSRNGYEVLEAYNGKKALELLDTVEPSLIMCDFRLEDMEGNVLLGKIKESPAEGTNEARIDVVEETAADKTYGNIHSYPNSEPIVFNNLIKSFNLN